MKTAMRILRWILFGLLGAALAAVFYVAVVMGQPSRKTAVTEQPLLKASAPLSISELSELQSLVYSFPVPVLAEAGHSGLTLESAASYDVSYENGYGRIMTLTYRTGDDLSIRVDSIYPARALTLLEKGFRVSGTAGHTVAGIRTVRMESSDRIRLHMQTSTGLYAVTLPMSAEGSIASIVRTMQLYGNSDQ